MAAVTINLTFTHEEVSQKIPYVLLCESRFGSRWNTGKVKREYEKTFAPEEREEAEGIFRMARRWHITSGVPEEVVMSARTYALWMKLAEFCGGNC